MKIKSASPNHRQKSVLLVVRAGVEQKENTRNKGYVFNRNIPDIIFSIVSSDKAESSKAGKTIR